MGRGVTWLGFLAVADALGGARAADATGFGGVPPLGPKDALRQLLAPYDPVKLNVLGANYCENLLDLRLNVTSYSHLNFDSSTGDAWHLQFPDDSARFLGCVAWEDQFSPVVRLELARRLTKGLLAARQPGTYASANFRHRSGGKTFLISALSARPPRMAAVRPSCSGWWRMAHCVRARPGSA